MWAIGTRRPQVLPDAERVLDVGGVEDVEVRGPVGYRCCPAIVVAPSASRTGPSRVSFHASAGDLSGSPQYIVPLTPESVSTSVLPEAAVAARITIVGGGSTHWTPRLLADFANTQSLQDARSSSTTSTPRRFLRCAGSASTSPHRGSIDLKVTSTTDLAEALDGAQFVISAFSVGGFESMAHDIEMPARYGVRQPVGDTVGPGWDIPVASQHPGGARDRRRDRAERARRPVPEREQPAHCAVPSRDQETSVKTVGLCNELVGLQFWLSLVFDAPMHEVDPVVAGVNHLPLVTSLADRVRRRVRAAVEGDARPGAARGPAGLDGPARRSRTGASSIRHEVGRRPTSSPTTA